MARSAYKAHFEQSFGEGQFNITSGSTTEPSVSLGAASTLLGTLQTAMDVLVADAASPTQAHVTTAAAALLAFTTSFNAANAASSASDAVLSVDEAVVTSQTHLKRAFDAILQSARNSGRFPA